MGRLTSDRMSYRMCSGEATSYLLFNHNILEPIQAKGISLEKINLLYKFLVNSSREDPRVGRDLTIYISYLTTTSYHSVYLVYRYLSPFGKSLTMKKEALVCF